MCCTPSIFLSRQEGLFFGESKLENDFVDLMVRLISKNITVDVKSAGVPNQWS